MEQLAVHLRSLVVATDEYRRAMASAAGIGLTEAAALGEILHEGPLTPSALVKRLGIASASVTALVDRLDAAGLVRRRPHPVDRRSVVLSLTPDGQALAEAMFALFSADIYLAVRDARPEHVREFSGAIERMQEALRSRAADREALAAALRRRSAPGEETPEPQSRP